MITTIRRISLVIILMVLLFVYLPNRIIEVITLSAVIVALFRDKLYSFFIPPNLVITSSNGPNHFNIAPILNKAGKPIDYMAYFGVIVENHGIGIAKNVELVFNGLESNLSSSFGRFQSIPLVRSWTHDPIVRNLPNRVSIRFDICFIKESSSDSLSFAFLSTPNELLNISCDLPEEETFFEFEVVALSLNAPLARRRVRITYDGKKFAQGFNVI